MSASRRITLDLERSLQEARDGGHTRWHPDIEPLAVIDVGERVRIDARDGGDVQIGPAGSGDGSEAYDLDRLHPLTGPFYIDGVRPGDLVTVELLDVDHSDFGWSRLVPGGGGLMRDFVHSTLLVRWSLHNGVARSADLPGVAIPGAPFVGTIGLAPSRARLAPIARRERVLSDEGGWALHPSPRHAIPEVEAVKAAGLRTLPPREFGGNLDIKDIAPGSRASFVANTPGGLLSMGDLHFAQGDGESFGTAIEISGTVEFRCTVTDASQLSWLPRGPFVETPPRSRSRDRRPYAITTGTSVDDADYNMYMDLNLATQNALREMVRHLVEARGLTEAQAQVLVSVAGDLRINVVNNPPNPVVSVALPVDVFE